MRHDLIDAVFALGGEDDLVRLLARVNALQKFVETEDGTNLLVAYKRAANILKKEDWTGGGDDLCGGAGHSADRRGRPAGAGRRPDRRGSGGGNGVGQRAPISPRRKP